MTYAEYVSHLITKDSAKIDLINGGFTQDECAFSKDIVKHKLGICFHFKSNLTDYNQNLLDNLINILT